MVTEMGWSVMEVVIFEGGGRFDVGRCVEGND